MSDQLIHKALERIRFHETEIQRLQQFVAMVEEINNDGIGIDQKEVVEVNEASEIKDGLRGASQGADDNSVPQRSSPTSIIISEAIQILSAERKPMAAALIYDRLIKKGMKIAGQNPKGNLTAKFATKKDVFSYDKATGLWALVSAKR